MVRMIKVSSDQLWRVSVRALNILLITAKKNAADGDGKPNQPMQTTASPRVSEVGPRKEHRGVTLISDVVPVQSAIRPVFEQTN